MSTQKVSFDWITILIYLLLVFTGWMAIYTADYSDLHTSIFDIEKNYGKQFIWIAVSLIIAFIIQIFDTRFYTGFAYLFYLLALILLIATLVIGATISGSTSWIRLGFFNLQPSEIAKFATCLGLAKFLSSINTSLSDIREQLIAGTFVIIPTALILAQGDPGSALVFGSLILVLYREGLSGGFLLLGALLVALFVLGLRLPFHYIMLGLIVLFLLFLLMREGFNLIDIIIYIIPVGLLALVSTYTESNVFTIILLAGIMFFLFAAMNYKRFVYYLLALICACTIYVNGVNHVYNNALKAHHKNRIGVMVGLIQDEKGVGYNLAQSKIAIGSGGLDGKGFLQGTQNKGKFVPELSTDFIFCTIGEEFGFIGSFVLIFLFLLLLLRIVTLAERQRSRFSRVYAYGVASVIFCHFIINIGMTIGLAPVIGIPLPFISYGGSALIGFTTLLFILVKLDSERLLYLR